jgi:hypothetical protein
LLGHIFPFQDVFQRDNRLDHSLEIQEQHHDANGAYTHLGDDAEGSQKPQASCTKRNIGQLSSASDRSSSGKSKKPQKKKRHSTKFTPDQTSILQAWLDGHLINPYPEKAEKEDLSVRTGLTVRQIEAWLARTRQRKLLQEQITPPEPQLNDSDASVYSLPFSSDGLQFSAARIESAHLDLWFTGPIENVGGSFGPQDQTKDSSSFKGP